MKRTSVFVTLFTLLLASIALTAEAEDQITASRITELHCTAENKAGDKIEFENNGMKVTAKGKDGEKAMRISNVGNNPLHNIAYVNLVSTTESAYVSFVFSKKELRTGKQELSGQVFTRVITNVFAPVVGYGNLWGTATCVLEISAR